MFECAFYIMINDIVYVGSINAFVIPNQFDIQPIYITDIALGQKII